MGRSHILQGLAILAGMGLYVYQLMQLPPPFETGEPGPSLYPWLIAVLLCACGLLLIRKGLRGAADENGPAPGGEFAGMARSLLAVAVTAGYLWLFSVAGFWLSSVLYASAIAVLFDSAKRRTVRAAMACLLIGIAITAVVYLLFTLLLGVRLPALRLP